MIAPSFARPPAPALDPWIKPALKSVSGHVASGAIRPPPLKAFKQDTMTPVLVALKFYPAIFKKKYISLVCTL